MPAVQVDRHDRGVLDLVVDRGSSCRTLPLVLATQRASRRARRRAVRVVAAREREPALSAAVGVHEPDRARPFRDAAVENDPSAVRRPARLVVLDRRRRVRDAVRVAPVGVRDPDLAPERAVLQPVAREGDPAAVVAGRAAEAGSDDDQAQAAPARRSSSQTRRLYVVDARPFPSLVNLAPRA